MDYLKICLIVSLVISFLSVGQGFLIFWRDTEGEDATEKCAEYSKFGKNEKNECYDDYFKTLNRNEDGEYTAVPSDFPHMVVIANSGFKTTCFGSLISKKFVLTVAECTKRFLEHKNGTDFIWAHFGNNTRNNSKAVTKKVNTVYIHPDFSLNPRQNDISLLEINEGIDLDEMKRPACINTKKEGNISGWGIESSDGGDMSTEAPELEKKMKIYLEGKVLSKQSRRDDSMAIALKNPRGKDDSCENDSGMPIVTTMENCTYNIVGLRTHGGTCTQYVTMYTNVSSHVKWIENIVWDTFWRMDESQMPFFQLNVRYSPEFGQAIEWRAFRKRGDR